MYATWGQHYVCSLVYNYIWEQYAGLGAVVEVALASPSSSRPLSEGVFEDAAKAAAVVSSVEAMFPAVTALEALLKEHFVNGKPYP